VVKNKAQVASDLLQR